MSLYQLFRNLIPRLTRTQWGNTITDRDGNERDSGVNALAEEIAAMLSSTAPLTLDEPLRIVKNYTGTTFEVVTEPDVEAANDPLSVDAFGGVKLTLEDVRDAAVAAQDTADNALALAAAAEAKKTVFPGIVTVEGDGTQQINQVIYTTLYRVRIDTGSSLVEVNAYPYRSGSRTFPVNTRVIVHLVDNDRVVTPYLDSKTLVSTPSYYFVEPHTTG